jgi:hypothetical protein
MRDSAQPTRILCCAHSACGDFGEKRIELVGGFVLDPVPCARDHLETGGWLDIA